jgi:excisionase family DNA binding protein
MLTIKDVAKILKLHELTVYRHIVSGKIRAVKVGKKYRIQEDELQRIMRDGM